MVLSAAFHLERVLTKLSTLFGLVFRVLGNVAIVSENVFKRLRKTINLIVGSNYLKQGDGLSFETPVCRWRSHRLTSARKDNVLPRRVCRCLCLGVRWVRVRACVRISVYVSLPLS